MENNRSEFEEPEFDTVHLIDYVNVLLKRRWLIVVGVFLSVLVVGIMTKRAKPYFTASAKFLPSKNPDMVSRMGTLVGGSNIRTFEDNVTSEYYTELIKSPLFLGRIAAKKFPAKKQGVETDLIEYYEIVGDSDREKLIKTTETVSKTLGISIDRQTKVVSLSYREFRPDLAAAIINAILDELIVYNQTIRDSKAKQNREFVENQLQENQKLLKEAEGAYYDFLSKNKKIASPEVEVERDRLKRAVTVQEEVYITLKKQLELAKIEEQEKKPAIVVLQRAEAPLRKSGPSARKNVMLAGFVSLVLFVGLAFVLEYVSKMKREEERNREFFKYLGDIKEDFRKVGRLVRISKKKPKTP